MSNQIPEGAVVITPAQMYLEQRATHDAVLELKGLVASSTAAISDQRIETERRIGDHEKRIRSIERKLWGLAGASTVIGAGVGVAASLLGRS